MKSPRTAPLSRSDLAGALAEVRERLAEAEETLRAIRSGEVDALVVAGENGDQVFTLEGAEHAYRVLIESMHEGALTLTSDEIILYANECFAVMVKCPLERVIGTSFHRFVVSEERESFRATLKCADTAGTKTQVRLRADDGSLMPAQISFRPLAKNGMNRATIGMVVTDMTEAHRIALQDKTERLYIQAREQATELERRVDERTQELLFANQELESFESSISHDLRGPLRQVMGFYELLIDDYGSQLPEGARVYLDKIHKGTVKMERLIQALLQFSRTSKQSLSLQSVDFATMVRDIFSEMASDIGDQQIDLTIGTLPHCQADPDLLRQVLVNLLGNAVKYSRTRERSLIDISSVASTNGGSATYIIKDNGVGFDMKNAHKLFAAFNRFHNARDFEGIGVGLNTAHRIIKRHGGRIWAESAPDAGATFSFTLGQIEEPIAK